MSNTKAARTPLFAHFEFLVAALAFASSIAVLFTSDVAFAFSFAGDKADAALVEQLRKNICLAPSASEPLLDAADDFGMNDSASGSAYDPIPVDPPGSIKTEAGGACAECDLKSTVASTKAMDLLTDTTHITAAIEAALSNDRVKRELAYFKSFGVKSSTLKLTAKHPMLKKIDGLKVDLEKEKVRQLEFKQAVTALGSLKADPPKIEDKHKQFIIKFLKDRIPNLKAEQDTEETRNELWSALMFLDWAESPTYDIPRPLDKALLGTKKMLEDQAAKLQKSVEKYELEIKHNEKIFAESQAKVKAPSEKPSEKGTSTAASPTELAELEKYESFYRSSLPVKNKGFQTCGLSVAELHAVWHYTSNGYVPLNMELRSGKPGSQAPFNAVLTSALAKLRPYQGMVKRGATLPQSILNQHSVGSIVTYQAFTSTSLGSGFSSDHQFVIKSKTGRFIAPLSRLQNENEVLFPPGTKFKILSRVKKGDKIEFVMEEVTD